MGFQAYENDENANAIKFSNNKITTMDDVSGITPSVQDYYGAVINQALATTDAKDVEQPEYDELCTYFKNYKIGKNTPVPVNIEQYFKDRTNLKKYTINKPIEETIELLSNVEAQYTWKYLKNKEAFEVDGQQVLNNLSIVPVSALNSMFITNYRNYSKSKKNKNYHWWTFQTKTRIAPLEEDDAWKSLKGSKDGTTLIYKTSHDSYYLPMLIKKESETKCSIYINTVSKLLFIDPNGNKDCFLDNKQQETKEMFTPTLTGNINVNSFYYQEGNDEDAFGCYCSQVVVNSNKLSSGYEGRSDPLNEIDYRWKFTTNTPTDIMQLTAFNVGLEINKKTAKDDTVLEKEGYFLTSSPSDKDINSNLTQKTDTTQNTIVIYKKIIEEKDRRNLPNGNSPNVNCGNDGTLYPLYPYIPRLYNKTDIDKNVFKLDANTKQYRVWKKSNKLEKTKGERNSANSTMAKALQNCSFYDTLKTTYASSTTDVPKKSKVTNSALPATSFAQGCVNEDDDIKSQWKNDKSSMSFWGQAEKGERKAWNSVYVDSPYCENFPQKVRTNQEWCHLLGHGDGGSEQLGNFVSGSRDCNTEQLAIESGQRRVTQDKAIKEKIQGSITAYLFPNKGITKKKSIPKEKVQDYDKEPYNKYLKIDDTSSDSDDIQTEDLVLEPNALDDLSKAINEETNADEKKKLFELKVLIEKELFLYLPLARAMRYKHYVNNQKVFDHIYDAQSESLSIIECRLLDYTIERVLYTRVKSEADYKKVLNKRTSKKLNTIMDLKYVAKISTIKESFIIVFQNFELLSESFLPQIIERADSRQKKKFIENLKSNADELLKTSNEFLLQLLEIEDSKYPQYQILKQKTDSIIATLKKFEAIENPTDKQLEDFDKEIKDITMFDLNSCNEVTQEDEYYKYIAKIQEINNGIPS